MTNVKVPEDWSRWVVSENICICWLTSRTLKVMIEKIPQKGQKGRKMTEIWLKISHMTEMRIP